MTTTTSKKKIIIPKKHLKDFNSRLYTNKLICLLSEGHVDDLTGAVRLGHPVPGDDWTLFCTGWLVVVLNAISDTALVDSLTVFDNDCDEIIFKNVQRCRTS